MVTEQNANKAVKQLKKKSFSIKKHIHYPHLITDSLISYT